MNIRPTYRPCPAKLGMQTWVKLKNKTNNEICIFIINTVNCTNSQFLSFSLLKMSLLSLSVDFQWQSTIY
jgi:hypothetical protein